MIGWVNSAPQFRDNLRLARAGHKKMCGSSGIQNTEPKRDAFDLRLERWTRKRDPHGFRRIPIRRAREQTRRVTVWPKAKVQQIECDRSIKHHLEFCLVGGSARVPAEFATHPMNVFMRNLNVLEQRRIDHRKV